MYKDKINFKKREVEGYQKLIAEAMEKVAHLKKGGDSLDILLEERRIIYFKGRIFDLERDIHRMEAGIPPKHF